MIVSFRAVSWLRPGALVLVCLCLLGNAACTTYVSATETHDLYLPIVTKDLGGSRSEEPGFTMAKTLSDRAQRNTIAFDALAHIELAFYTKSNPSVPIKQSHI